MSKLNTAGKVAIVATAFLVLGSAGNAQTIDTTGFSNIRKFVNSLKSKGPMVDSRFGNPTTKQMPGVSSGSTPSDIYNSQLSGIADRVNVAIASEIPGIEKDLANLEKDANGSLDPQMLAIAKRGISDKKAELSSTGAQTPTAAIADSAVGALVQIVPVTSVTDTNDNKQGILPLDNVPTRDYGAELGDIATRLNDADTSAIAGIEKDLANLEKDANGSLEIGRAHV